MSPKTVIVLWGALAILLALGLLTTVLDLTRLSSREGARAYAEHQRFLVNPASSEVSLAASTADGEDTGFDVSHDETPDTAHATTKNEEPTTAPEAAPATPETAPATPEAAPATNPSAKPETPAPAEPAQTPPASMPALRTSALENPLLTPSHTKDSLVAAPAPEVTETVDGLSLPKRGEKDVTPASLYARPFTHKPEQITIALVVMGVGLNPQSVGLTMGLPKEVTAAYSPYARKESSYIAAMRTLGHEVWTVLPVMNERYPNDDPGPLGMIAKMPAEEMLRRLRLTLDAVPGSVGLLLPPDEAISTYKDALSQVLKEIDTRGLLFATSHPTRSADQLASDKSLTAGVRRADLVLDTDPGAEQIQAKLAGLLQAAKEKGEYIVVLSDQPQSLMLVKEWLEKNPLPEGYALAPLSAMYGHNAATEAEPPSATEASNHGGGGEKKKEKKKPKEKPKKPLPQDRYLQPAAGASGGHGGGEGEGGGGH